MMSAPEDPGASARATRHELIEFRLFSRRPDGALHEGVYGISVSRIREVVQCPDIEPVPDSHPAVEGLFHSRGEAVPVVHLGRWLRVEEAPPTEISTKVIVCEVAEHVVGLHVHQADRIRSVPWSDVQPPPPLIAQQHGSTISGTVRLDNERTLLIVDVEAVVADVLGFEEGPQASQPAAATGARILVTDDSATVRKRLRRLLEEAGYDVIEAEDGVAAMDRLQSLTAIDSTGGGVDLLLTDVEMPRRNGFELVQAVRADPDWSKLPIAMHSSLASDESVRRGQEAGCDAYLVKFNADQLLHTVAQLLAG